jgi:hypothetical protein
LCRLRGQRGAIDKSDTWYYCILNRFTTTHHHTTHTIQHAERLRLVRVVSLLDVRGARRESPASPSSNSSFVIITHHFILHSHFSSLFGRGGNCTHPLPSPFLFHSLPAFRWQRDEAGPTNAMSMVTHLKGRQLPGTCRAALFTAMECIIMECIVECFCSTSLSASLTAMLTASFICFVECTLYALLSASLLSFVALLCCVLFCSDQ